LYLICIFDLSSDALIVTSVPEDESTTNAEWEEPIPNEGDSLGVNSGKEKGSGRGVEPALSILLFL
jgi:hypothetical protein